LQHQRLELVREGKLSGEFGFAIDYSSSPMECSSLGRSPPSDVAGNLWLVPKCAEKDPDLFEKLFESVADSQALPDADCTLMLQCVLTGRAQEAYLLALHIAMIT
jgi:hypothetical protein